MTVVFFKANGQIKDVFSGDLQHIDNIYGDLSESFKLICDELIIDDDNFVINNISQFKVDVENRKIILNTSLLKYQ